MTFLEHINAFERLHALILTKSTSTPEQLAKRLFLTLSTLYSMLHLMKERGAPIIYNKNRPSYQYEFDVSIILFEILPVNSLIK